MRKEKRAAGQATNKTTEKRSVHSMLTNIECAFFSFPSLIMLQMSQLCLGAESETDRAIAYVLTAVYVLAD